MFLNKIKLLICVLVAALLSGCGVEVAAPEPQAAPIGPPQVLEIPVADRVRFTDNYVDYVVDGDGDGLFETLVIDVEVDVTEEGEYNFGASLSVIDGGGVTHGIDGVQRWLYLDKGVQKVSMTFEGRYIVVAAQNGPYRLTDLWVTHIQNPTPMQLRENVIDQREVPYVTASYGFAQFQGP